MAGRITSDEGLFCPAALAVSSIRRTESDRARARSSRPLTVVAQLIIAPFDGGPSTEAAHVVRPLLPRLVPPTNWMPPFSNARGLIIGPTNDAIIATIGSAFPVTKQAMSRCQSGSVPRAWY